MSEHTPDSASDLEMDTSDMDNDSDGIGLSGGDTEPSMEDILASIRQIIADDQTENLSGEIELEPETTIMDHVTKEAVQAEPVAELPMTEAAQVAVEVELNDDVVTQGQIVTEDTDETDILDLISFIDENVESDDGELQLDTEQDALSQDPNFDESLDLVMDADASDYLTTNLAPQPDMDSADIDDKDLTESDVDLAIPETVQKLDKPEVQTTPEVDVAQPPVDEDMDLVKSLLADLMDEPTAVEVPDTDVEKDLKDHSAVMDEVFDNTQMEENVSKSENASDTEIDFVTGLAIDNTDVDAIFNEEIPTDLEIVADAPEETVQVDIPDIKQPQQAVKQDVDFVTGQMIDTDVPEGLFDDEDTPDVLDDILQKSVEDEVALHEELAVEIVEPEPETVAETVSQTDKETNATPDLDNDSEEQSTQENVKASKVELKPASAVHEKPDIKPEPDKVSLPQIDVSSKFSLLAKTSVGVSALGLGTAAALMKSDNTNKKSQKQEETEPALVETQKAVQENSPLPKEKNNEDKTMAQAANTENLANEGTTKESASAFASLTSAVAEKTKLDESGPAIGDLVQEALKPMLKEWLDKNLKGIVERAVTKEVKRISSGK